MCSDRKRTARYTTIAMFCKLGFIEHLIREIDANASPAIPWKLFMEYGRASYKLLKHDRLHKDHVFFGFLLGFEGINI